VEGMQWVKEKLPSLTEIQIWKETLPFVDIKDEEGNVIGKEQIIQHEKETEHVLYSPHHKYLGFVKLGEGSYNHELNPENTLENEILFYRLVKVLTKDNKELAEALTEKIFSLLTQSLVDIKDEEGNILGKEQIIEENDLIEHRIYSPQAEYLGSLTLSKEKKDYQKVDKVNNITTEHNKLFLKLVDSIKKNLKVASPALPVPSQQENPFLPIKDQAGTIIGTERIQETDKGIEYLLFTPSQKYLGSLTIEGTSYNTNRPQDMTEEENKLLDNLVRLAYNKHLTNQNFPTSLIQLHNDLLFLNQAL
jgi:hypothetical protein